MKIKKEYIQPAVDRFNIGPAGIIASSVNIEGTNQETPSWDDGDDTSDEDIRSNRRSGWEESGLW